MSVRRRPPGRLLAIIAAPLVVATGCELADTTAPSVESRVVVHAVLNPTSTQQNVIVERTLRSVLEGSTGGVPYHPIAGARVVIYGPREDSVVAVAGSGTSSGTYRVQSVTITNGSAGTASPNVLRLRPGERYRLRVETSLGVVTGETRIPAAGGPVDGARRTFNLDRDTLRLDVAAVRNAAGFVLRHETRARFEERYRTGVNTALVLPLALGPGDPEELEWSFSFAHSGVLPGLAQNFIVVAVDSNYFRYNVAGFDPFGDETRGNTLTGGVGLFGSVAPLMAKTLDLTADIDTPAEGAWTAERNSATLPLTLSLYSSPYFPSSTFAGRISISGRGRLFTGRALEAFGTTTTAGISLELVDPNDPTQSTVVTGLLSSGALVLTDTRTGERVTYRKP